MKIKDLYITSEKRFFRQEPSEKERKRRTTLFLKELPDRDDLYAARLKDLQYEFGRKAEEQGIAFELEDAAAT